MDRTKPPVPQKIIKAHLLGVEDDPDDGEVALLKLRDVSDGVSGGVSDGSISFHRVPRGTVLVRARTHTHTLTHTHSHALTHTHSLTRTHSH
jgi:hypothetical protein